MWTVYLLDFVGVGTMPFLMGASVIGILLALLGLLRGMAGARPAYLAVALALSGVVLIWADRRANLWALLHFGGEPGIIMVTLVAIAGSWLLLASTWLLSRYGCRYGRR